MKKSRRTYNGVHLNKKSNTQDVVEQSLTIYAYKKLFFRLSKSPCRNIYNKFSFYPFIQRYIAIISYFRRTWKCTIFLCFWFFINDGI